MHCFEPTSGQWDGEKSIKYLYNESLIDLTCLTDAPQKRYRNSILLCYFQTPEHQTILFNHGAIQNIAPLLISPSYKVLDSF